MRIALIVHGFPPYERTGVENYTRSLAGALTAAGHSVEVFAPCPAGDLPHLALRREVVDNFAVTWLAIGVQPSNPTEQLNPTGVASRFGDFLDRERPDLVHFQHVVKLGTALIAEAEKRGIPTVYTAHDYYAYCHRYTLLRPDLERCEIVGDPSACARCDTALAVLNEVEALGDYQMGALPEQLDGPVGQRLADALDGERKGTGPGKQAEQAALKLRRELDARRAEDFGRLDLILAPTLFLRDKLIEGGLSAQKIEHLPYGIETSALERVARESVVEERTPNAEHPLRIGYFGGFSKHKGVHVLLDAFAKLEGPAILELHGIGSDVPYVELLRERARAVKAKWCGPYEPAELPGALAEVDVVVVPSLWVENYPIVIREAFAAGRPVIASRLGALPESVRDGVDGLLFEPGDAEALAKVLQRCVGEPGLLAELASHIEPVHTIRDQAEELGEIYARVVPSRPARKERKLPASLVASVERYAALRAMPTRELFTRAMAGIQDLAAELLPRSAPDGMTLFASALAGRSEAQNQLRDRRSESDWVRQTLVEEERELNALSQKLEWMSDVVDGREKAVADLERERGWLSESIEARKAEIEALASERDDVLRARADLDQQRKWLEGALSAKEETIEALEKREKWHAEVLAGREKELEEVEKQVRDLGLALESKQAELSEQTLAVAELRKQVDWLNGVVEDRTFAVAELEKKSAWLEGLLKDSRERSQEIATELNETKHSSAREVADLEETSTQQSEQLQEQQARLKRHENIELELRAWLEASREVLEAFDELGSAGVAALDPSVEPLSRAVRDNWKSVLRDVERVLDADEQEVAPDELGERVEQFLARLDTEERELFWRRKEMDLVGEAAQQWIGKRLALCAGTLNQRIRQWQQDASREAAE